MGFSSFSPDLSTFAKNWGWMLLLGLVFIALGILAISYVTLTTLLSVAIIGFVLVASGVVALVNAFTVWRFRASRFWLYLFLAILYIAAGIMLVTNPLSGSISLTLLLGVLYIILGLVRIFNSSAARLPGRWGWYLFSGIIALLLGTLILTQWPASSLYIIGLFVGIDLIFYGWAYVITAFGARSLR